MLQQTDDEVQIELYVYVSEELKMMIRGYGNQVKVVEPKSLADAIWKIFFHYASYSNG